MSKSLKFDLPATLSGQPYLLYIPSESCLALV
ncbi:MAG: hypothetical protein BWY02_01288 [bacterium ADurb.Bin157]|nr:MAG: hypothetical protein BWY02_01288 [bacterium ADurb.Bin157]